MEKLHLFDEYECDTDDARSLSREFSLFLKNIFRDYPQFRRRDLSFLIDRKIMNSIFLLRHLSKDAMIDYLNEIEESEKEEKVEFKYIKRYHSSEKERLFLEDGIMHNASEEISYRVKKKVVSLCIDNFDFYIHDIGIVMSETLSYFKCSLILRESVKLFEKNKNKEKTKTKKVDGLKKKIEFL